MDGVDFTFATAAVAGDSYLVRPTVNGAAQMSMAIKDPTKVAAAAPIMASAPSGNKGSAKITDGVVDKNFLCLATGCRRRSRSRSTAPPAPCPALRSTRT